MQLAGPHVFGPPKDVDAAVAVLREAVESGIDHIDTSDFYGPHITNQIIKRALHPYGKNLTLVTKVGARRGDDGSWIMDTTPKTCGSRCMIICATLRSTYCRSSICGLGE